MVGIASAIGVMAAGRDLALVWRILKLLCTASWNHCQKCIADHTTRRDRRIPAVAEGCRRWRGTGSSNPSPSSGESANYRFLSDGAR